jgi:hypothetical protein
MIKASKMVLEIKIDLVCKDRKSTFLAQKKLNFWVEASLQKLNTEMCTRYATLIQVYLIFFNHQFKILSTF